ncbi:Hypothetical protein, putative [Bodo saltans]|uniref:Importin N-terminal domain-containing protein n=1 Tax=Bodo saltans TaxID=75058 RepID=A0A0S4J3W9_BODSA|nr:Hypothetical protein, putative [Bodo saltans]|eukprot:CUG86134.1 Hypothetical protein, putative [Bodo saltans]
MEQAPDIDSVRNMLMCILTTMDNNERRQAEIAIVKALRSSSTATLLVQLLRDTATTSAGARQLSAILLRKKLFSLWRSLSIEHQQELKNILLTQLGAEPVKIVRFAIAHVVSILAKAEARDEHGWPELQQSIFSAMQSPDAEMRELSMVLSYSIAEVFGDQPTFINGVGQAVVGGLSDSALNVRLAAIKAVGVILPFLHGQKSVKATMHASIIPIVIQTIESNIADPNALTLVLRTMELAEQLCEELHTNTHSEYLMQLFQMLLTVMGAVGASHLRVREHASEVLGMVVQNKPKFIQKANLIDQLVRGCLTVMSEEESISFPFDYDEEEQDMDDDDVELLRVRTPCMFASRLLNLCCSHLSTKTVTASAMSMITAVLENPAAAPLLRKAAIIGLACLSEGNPGYLRRRVTMILNAVQLLLQDASHIPREAAAFALMYFSDHLQPEILTHHHTLLPLLIEMLKDQHDNVRRRVAETLDTLCENVAENLEPYIVQLMPRIMEAIPISTTATQEALVSAISSVAQTQCPAFQQFGESVLALLREPMSLDISHPSLLRVKATECVGIVSLAMGRERYQPFFHFFMEKVVENLNTTRAELREESFGFLANMCEMLKEQFVPFLNDAVTAAIESINRDVGHVENKHLLAQAASIQLGIHDDSDDNDSDGEDEDEDPNEMHVRVRTADVEEKSSAAYCIGTLAEVLKVENFGLVRLQMCWQTLVNVSGHFHPNVRSNALEALTKIAIAAQGTVPFAKSPAGAIQENLNADVREIINGLLYEVLYPCMAGETEKEVVAAACDALQKLIQYFGAQTFSSDIADLCAVIGNLLRNEAPCQANDEDVNSDDDGEDGAAGDNIGEDHDHVLMDAVCDTIDTLAEAFGASFEPYFRELGPHLLKYLAEGRPAEDFTMAAGVMANCFMSMGPSSEPYFNDAITIAQRIIYETDESAAKANCCFIIRALMEHCSHCISNTGNQALLQQILTALWNVAGSNDEIPQACDNAISATCTVVMKLAPMVPMQAVVPTLLQHLPMKVDKDENKNGVACLCYLIQFQSDFVGANLASVLTASAKVMIDRSVTDDLKQQLGSSLRQLGAAHRGPVETAIGALHPTFQKNLRFMLQ